ncbi:hypothetical protein [Burkholderia territorii]|uniref:hypothetical protein n=1 Tax=Burkholderia territorii TaxID=1503055 RepID=UPI000ADBF183|nr:hypothetical protein [Burkholderia territorii]
MAELAKTGHEQHAAASVEGTGPVRDAGDVQGYAHVSADHLAQGAASRTPAAELHVAAG